MNLEKLKDVGGNKFEKQELVKEQLKFIDDIFEKVRNYECPLYLIGGFADEFLLNPGDVKKEHGDVDLVGFRSDVDKIKEILTEVGCSNVKEIFKGKNYHSDGFPLKVIARNGRVSVDIPLMDFNRENESFYYAITNNDGERFHIYFDRELFSSEQGEQSDGYYPTISALGLVQTRLFYPAIENIKLREKDREAAEIIRSKFFPEKDLNDPIFMPNIVKIETF